MTQDVIKVWGLASTVSLIALVFFEFGAPRLRKWLRRRRGFSRIKTGRCPACGARVPSARSRCGVCRLRPGDEPGGRALLEDAARFWRVICRWMIEEERK